MKTQAAQMGKYMAKRNIHNDLLMQSSYLTVQCDPLKEFNIKLLQEPECCNERAYLIPRIPFELLEGKKTID